MQLLCVNILQLYHEAWCNFAPIMPILQKVVAYPRCLMYNTMVFDVQCPATVPSEDRVSSYKRQASESLFNRKRNSKILRFYNNISLIAWLTIFRVTMLQNGQKKYPPKELISLHVLTGLNPNNEEEKTDG